MTHLPAPVRSAQPATVTHDEPRVRTLNVLLADADQISRQQRERDLLARGVQVLTARTGFEAIVKASCRMPDLIILDESLGGVEVAETARLLTVCPVTANIPLLRVRRRRPIPVRLLARLRRRPLS